MVKEKYKQFNIKLEKLIAEECINTLEKDSISHILLIKNIVNYVVENKDNREKRYALYDLIGKK